MLSRVKITVLAENRVVNPMLLAEHGLSIHIESPEGNFLFDAGQMHSFIHNAEHLGIDLSKIDKIFLSHGHYDHVGGLYNYLKRYEKARVICHPNIFHKKFIVVNGERLEVSSPYEEDEFRALGAEFIFKANPYHFSENILSSGEIPRVDDYEQFDNEYQERVLESYIHDELHDDMAMILQTEKGLIVLMGCGHSGLINTLKHAMRLTGIDNIYAVMGGMHLSRSPQEKIEKIGHNLRVINPQYIIPLHCTGFRAINYFYRLFEDRLLLFNVGNTFTLEK